METKTTYYKVIRGDNHATDNTDFNYLPYLPHGNKKGKWLPKIENVELCNRGYHITKYWNMWVNPNCKIFEVEYRGMKAELDHCGVEDKVVCESIRLVKEVTKELLRDYNAGDYNAGDYNTGDYNTGDFNAGNFNTGDYNAGNRNTGYFNAGNFNTGDYNTGDYNAGNRNAGNFNTGDFNTGNRNTGNRNAGYFNAGNFNTGDYNTGDYNAGNRNAGNFNTGNFNTGNYNTGNFNTGYFNTDTPRVRIFNKETDVAREDIKIPRWLFIELPTKDRFRKAFNGGSLDDVGLTLSLPNFDYEIFEEITGISKADFEKKLTRK